ncbi:MULTISPECIES: outer membrane lipoprotein chaperone LolA [Gallibacterium]|uniref:Outer-membrane lipoprotein carrier protein n=2 Tax=Gallibacterium TaxID=155493 RepID=A0A0A2XZY1_9PAST|nr:MULTISPECIES: outer membrane lipoprotein chaperone LolA [Gallibacterium]KGQ30844.1 lipoprotein chaperone [Gallibacterium anatis]KGQ36995.1 lipoprotein chaperone [Gallibacterium genomosp. 1]MDK9430003.1 outer membrane lipoprotein chaperone LolA [Gallibacterium anatis]WIM80022.1 outer membrane lipoprotein chaperone LolA [Gallibacterium anatis]
MKKLLTFCVLCGLLCSTTAFADAKSELQQRLSQINSLSSQFQQRVSDAEGKVVQQGEGTLQIKHPNLFKMEISSPQESEMVSDGKTLWYYDPFVEQATANWVSEAVNNTPFVLLTSDDQHHWASYQVTQKQDVFTLTPVDKKSNIKQFTIRINANGLLNSFSTIEKDGQANLYILRNINTSVLPDSTFKFTLPKGAELDDQRKK